MSEEDRTFKLSMNRIKDFIFKVNFDIPGVELILDEPEPVGGNNGPSASKVLAAAIGNCLSASLLFCLQKARAEVGNIETYVTGKIRRNEKGRWRIVEVNVEIAPQINLEENQSQYERCLDLFEDFCIVSQSVKEGIPIYVDIKTR
jgi:uncharacterized OsmC-like protein